MGYLKFDKEQLVNLEYSLSREIIRSNRAGSYISTTISGCNTRKYHGLLVCPIKNFGGEKHVLLSSLDVSVLQKGQEFNLALRRYQGGIYEPKGHKYLSEIQIDKVPKYIWCVGNVVLSMERILAEKEEQVMIRYTLEDSQSPVKFRFRPFLAFRNIHQLSKSNLYANTKYKPVKNGISTCLYENFPELNMQFSRKAEFIPIPDWYYNIEYQKELSRGYDYLEDLFVPGFFELTLKKGESVIFSGGTFEMNPPSLKQKFETELNRRIPRESLRSLLENSAEQFEFQKGEEVDIVAGFPWYGSITRQTFISLPGISLAIKNPLFFQQVLDTYVKYLKDGLFPNQIHTSIPVYNSADAPLWFIWAVQQLYKRNKNARELWEKYGEAIKEILLTCKQSENGIIGTTKEGLLYAEKENTGLTWMNSYAYGVPVVQRAGCPIELNALWYNAICFAKEIALLSDDKKFITFWKGVPEKLGKAMISAFTSPGHDHLADVVRGKNADWAVRPNMIIAVAMDYTPFSNDKINVVLNIAEKKLLTKRGLRTLSPDHIRYKGSVEGNSNERETATHLGTVWPWLLQFFIPAWLKIHGIKGKSFVQDIVNNFEEEMSEHCVGTISEMYNGNPPHKAKGAVSQAWNVAGLIYSTNIIDNFRILK